LFLKFTGPGIILIQSRAPRLADTFTAKDVAEVGELDPSAKEAIIERIQRYPANIHFFGVILFTI
jgi:hypothetical protein